MSVSVALVVGAVIGALDGVGIFFARDEPFKIEIFVAAILKGILVALLTGLSLTRSSGGGKAPYLDCCMASHSLW